MRRRRRLMDANASKRRRRSARDVDLLRVPAHLLKTCHVSGKRVLHKPHCTIGHPTCKWRRKEAGQVVCDCPAYGFPHRQGSGLCGQQIYGKWRRGRDPSKRICPFCKVRQVPKGRRTCGASICLHEQLKAAKAKHGRRDASRPPPLPSHEVRTMATMLSKAGVPRPATSAQRLAQEGIGPAELAFRLKVDTRPPARSRTRRRTTKKRTRR